MEKLSKDELAHIIELEDKLKYRFNNKHLLLTALTHRSWVGDFAEHPTNDNQNETLEFLGDSVLDLVVAKLILFIDPEFNEGDLTKIRSSLVNKDSLAQKASLIDLGKFIRLGKGERRSRGEQKPSILADSFEAVCGALFLDAGFEKTLEITAPFFNEAINKILNEDHSVNSGDFGDFKSALQEFTQGEFKLLPSYKFMGYKGSKGDSLFHFGVMLDDKIIAYGEGTSKKKAQQAAAYNALQKLKTERDSFISENVEEDNGIDEFSENNDESV